MEYEFKPSYLSNDTRHGLAIWTIASLSNFTSEKTTTKFFSLFTRMSPRAPTSNPQFLLYYRIYWWQKEIVSISMDHNNTGDTFVFSLIGYIETNSLYAKCVFVMVLKLIYWAEVSCYYEKTRNNYTWQEIARC